MPTPSTSENEKLPQNTANWAQRIFTLQVSRVPTGALNLNVAGRRLVGPLQGFGQMWQKTYRLRLPAMSLTSVEIMQIWKTNFTHFQPPGNRFYPVVDDVEPGHVLLINASLTGMPISTGVMVLYADDESFTLMTSQGHPESGWVTFSTYEEEGSIVCQVQSIARANDPLYELAFRLFGSSAQERIWVHVLEALAAHLQVHGTVEVNKVCVDPHVQWLEATNIWQNAAVRTLLYMLRTPLRWRKRPSSR